MFANKPPNYFTINYEGRFRGDMRHVFKISDYLGGKVDYVDNCDNNVMFLIELDHILFLLRYKYCIEYFYANKKVRK